MHGIFYFLRQRQSLTTIETTNDYWVSSERHRQNGANNVSQASKQRFLELATPDLRMISNALSTTY